MVEILHLSYNPNQAGWVLRLQTQLQQSPSPLLKERYSKWKDLGMAELGMAFVSRLEMRNRAGHSLSNLLNELRNEINGSGKIDELLDGGYAYQPDDANIFYDICVAIDALYFETRSAYEIFGKFVRTLGEKLLERNFTEKQIKRVLMDNGQETDWIGEIREHRKLFFHDTAPWIALSINSRLPLNFELVIMKENIKDFSDPKKFITQKQIYNSWQGFNYAIPAICTWLKEQIIEFEKSEQTKKQVLS